MIAYVQKHRGEFANINTLTAFLGFTEKGYEVRCFEASELEELPLDRDTLVVGGIKIRNWCAPPDRRHPSGASFHTDIARVLRRAPSLGRHYG